MRIDEQITKSFLGEFMYSYMTVVHTNIKMPVMFFTYFFFRNKYLRQPSNDFVFWNLMASGDVFYKKR